MLPQPISGVPCCDNHLVKITTWNVNGIRAREAQVREWIDREQPDIVPIEIGKVAQKKAPRRRKSANG